MTTLRPEVLAKYPNDVFIETGTYEGEGCLVAVNAGFKQVISFEISPVKHKTASERIRLAGLSNTSIFLMLGDTTVLLPLTLQGINQRCTFWLDAHMPEDGAKHATTWSSCPIMLELAAIRQHHIRDHTIMIDDLNHFRSGVYDYFTETQLKDALRLINPNYRFVYEDGAGHETVLVAVP